MFAYTYVRVEIIQEKVRPSKIYYFILLEYEV